MRGFGESLGERLDESLLKGWLWGSGRGLVKVNVKGMHQEIFTILKLSQFPSPDEGLVILKLGIVVDISMDVFCFLTCAICVQT